MGKHDNDWQEYRRVVGSYIPSLIQANDEFFAACAVHDIAPPKVFGHASGSKGTDRKAEHDRTKVNMERFTAWRPTAAAALAQALKRKQDAAAAAVPKPKANITADKKLAQLLEAEVKKVVGDWEKHKARHTGLGCQGCRSIQDKHTEWHNLRKVPKPCAICARIKEAVLSPAAGK